jgi:hypothetical protein
MFTQGLAEVIVDALTINPAIKLIPSASAILDASNFTFNAITYGKDGDGFKFHAHAVSSFNSGVYNDGYVLMVRRNSVSPSSYHSSATHQFFSATYNSIPSYPAVNDTRLERKSTVTNVLSQDFGHYINAAIDPSLSSVWNVVGSFPPSGNSGKYMLVDSAGGFVMSGNLSGVYNSNRIVDKNGFVKINELPGSATVAESISAGPYISTAPTFSAQPIINMAVVPQLGDGAALAAFGGINHLGVWCLDLKAMLASGLTPPFAWDNLNNTRKYKLVAKVTSWSDLLHHDDVTEAGLQLLFLINSKSFSGYKSLLVEGFNNLPLNFGPGIILNISFV